MFLNFNRINTKIFVLWLFVVACTMGIVFTHNNYDNDVWWHLKYGEYFVTHLTWNIDHSGFSWTPADSNWPYVSWLGSSALYLINSLFNIRGLFSLPLVTLIIIFALYWWFLKRTDRPFNFTSVALFFAASGVFYSPIVRPTLFSSIFFTACVAIFFVSRDSDKPWYYLYPLLFLAWVNTHGGFIFGFFFLSLCFAMEVIQVQFSPERQQKKEYLRGFFIAVVLSGLALLVNPLGIDYITGLAKTLLFSDYLPDVNKRVTEFQSLWRTMSPTGNSLSFIFGAWEAVLLFASCLILLLLNFRVSKQIDLTLLVANTVFFILSMVFARCLMFFSMLWLFSCIYSMGKFILSKRPRTVCFFIMSLLAYHMINSIYSTILWSPQLAFLGSDVATIYPYAAADFIKKHELPQPLINDYGTGGYLIWALYPDYKVFIDPRYGPYKHDVLINYYAFQDSKKPEEISKITDKYGIQTAVIALSYQNLVNNFLKLDEWRMVYFDHVETIFVRKTALKENIQADLGPHRFETDHNPLMLSRLFALYTALGKKDEATAVQAIYRRNVRSMYIHRDMDLKAMDITLGSMK